MSTHVTQVENWDPKSLIESCLIAKLGIQAPSEAICDIYCEILLSASSLETPHKVHQTPHTNHYSTGWMIAHRFGIVLFEFEDIVDRC